MVYLLYLLLLVTFSSLAMQETAVRTPSPKIPMHRNCQKELIRITLDDIKKLIKRKNKEEILFLSPSVIEELSNKLKNDFFRELPVNERVIPLDKMHMRINSLIEKYEASLNKPKVKVDKNSLKTEVEETLKQQNIDVTTLSVTFIAGEVHKDLKKHNKTKVTKSRLSKSTEDILTRQMVPRQPLSDDIFQFEE